VHIRPATVAELAGGYESHIACQRALHDAFCGLCFMPTNNSVSIMDSSWWFCVHDSEWWWTAALWMTVLSRSSYFTLTFCCMGQKQLDNG